MTRSSYCITGLCALTFADPSSRKVPIPCLKTRSVFYNIPSVMSSKATKYMFLFQTMVWNLVTHSFLCFSPQYITFVLLEKNKRLEEEKWKAIKYI